MTAWLALFLPVLATVGVIALLGIPVALALRTRGYLTMVVAVIAAVAVIAVSSIIAPVLGLTWSLLPPLAVTVLLSLVLLLSRRWLAPRARVAAPGRDLITALVAAAVGGLATVAVLMMSLKHPEAISQTYDANFHLNAVRQVLDTGSASPLDMDLSAPGHDVFYPTLWHAFVALTVGLTGASIPLATNAMVFVVCGVVWPIGMVALGRAVGGPSSRVTLISGVLAAAFPNFPLTLVGYGVLYPNLLSISLIPFALVGMLGLLALGRARRSESSSLGIAWLLFLGGLGAAVFAHPNAVHIVVLWMIGPVLIVVVRSFRESTVPGWNGLQRTPIIGGVPRRALASLAIPLLVLVIAGAWYIGRTSDNPWGGRHGPFGALRDALGMTPHLEGHAWPVTILVLLGFLIAWRVRALRWVFVTALVFLALYVVADGFPPGDWRTRILSPWYSDPWRIAALVWLGVFPLAVVGAGAAWAVARRGVLATAQSEARPRVFRVLALVVGGGFLLAATQGAGATEAVRFVSSNYESSSSARLVSDDERELLLRLSDHVPEDAVIVNNPWNGGALAYALSGASVLVPHPGGTYDPRIKELTTGLSEGESRSCELVNEFGAQFVLDFGSRFVFAGTPLAEPYEGITDVEESLVLTEVDREGDAVLFEITGC